MEANKGFALEDALAAQKALRKMAGLEPESFPVQAFVGMISDEIELLRQSGHGDEEIARVIEAHSKIRITAAEIAENYASPEERQQHHE